MPPSNIGATNVDSRHGRHNCDVENLTIGDGEIETVARNCNIVKGTTSEPSSLAVRVLIQAHDILGVCGDREFSVPTAGGGTEQVTAGKVRDKLRELLEKAKSESHSSNDRMELYQCVTSAASIIKMASKDTSIVGSGDDTKDGSRLAAAAFRLSMLRVSLAGTISAGELSLARQAYSDANSVIGEMRIPATKLKSIDYGDIGPQSKSLPKGTRFVFTVIDAESGKLRYIPAKIIRNDKGGIHFHYHKQSLSKKELMGYVQERSTLTYHVREVLNNIRGAFKDFLESARKKLHKSPPPLENSSELEDIGP
jgi:hypothetical protein